MKLIYRGAEAELWKSKFLGLPCVLKKRIRKEYRIKEIDERIRTSRVKNETRMLIKARRYVNTPHVLDVDEDECSIILEYIEGMKVRDIIYEGKMVERIGKEIGKSIRKLHDAGIVHNDLTTSNFIWNGKLWLIDFGLAKSSERIEDKATDLVVFKRMIFASHWDVADRLWKAFSKGYRLSKKMEERIKEIESRAKYM